MRAINVEIVVVDSCFCDVKAKTSLISYTDLFYHEKLDIASIEKDTLWTILCLNVRVRTGLKST